MTPSRSRPPLDGKDKTAIRSPARRTEALNANHSAAAPGLDGVRLPLRTVVATKVLSANSGHCTAIPGAVAPLWEPANVHGTAPATVLPTPRTFHVLSPPQEPSNGMGTTLGRGPDLDQIKTPTCRTLGTLPRHAWRTYPLQEPPCCPLELPGRRRDLRRTKDDTQDNCTPSASLSSAAQCTFYSILPLHAPDSGKTTTSPL